MNTIIVAFIFSVFGLMVGSFLNVVIDRLPAGQSLSYPPSHCASCNRRLALKDLIPVFSYTLLGGRCRYCAERITSRIPMVEAGTAISFGLIYWFGATHWHMGTSASTDFALVAVALVYTCLLIVIAVIDLNHQLILNKLVYPGLVIGTIVSLAHTFLKFGTTNYSYAPYLSHAAAGLAAGFIIFLLIVILSRGGMGMGDVKMAALMGVILGFPTVLVAIFLAIVVGGITAIVLLVTRKKGRKQVIPFGPFLALGTALALLWGSSLWEVYTRGFK